MLIWASDCQCQDIITLSCDAYRLKAHIVRDLEDYAARSWLGVPDLSWKSFEHILVDCALVFDISHECVCRGMQ